MLLGGLYETMSTMRLAGCLTFYRGLGYKGIIVNLNEESLNYRGIYSHHRMYGNDPLPIKAVVDWELSSKAGAKWWVCE